MDRFYGQFIQPGDLCFDVGSHVGNRVRSWRSLGATVVAIEPQPDFMRILELLYGRSEHVHLEAIGVADAPGTLELHISRAAPTVSTFASGWIDEVASTERWSGITWEDRVQVEVHTLDQLIEAYGPPAFCKVDVEGFEATVLSGLSQPIAALSFEYVPEALDVAVACIEHLSTLGSYRFRTSKVETMRWVEDDWLSAGQMCDQLSSMGVEASSGDVYAKLR
ncbi:MAG TPA: FkbM family methyltransferase [Deltaproteobacteria bacterium]|nr:FkbM family methyltransferase [Deltaproteobacteria bacterium]